MTPGLSVGATIALFFFVGLFALVTVGALVAIAVALNKTLKKVDELTVKVEPVIAKTTDTLETVQRITMTVGEKADHILTRGEAVADAVSDRVDKTSTVVQSAVTAPLISLSSLIAGVSKGFSVWSRAGANGGHGNGRTRITPTVEE